MFRYPSDPPERFFPWLRETIAYRALDQLRGELPEAETCGASVLEAEAMQAVLAGFEGVDAPAMRDRRGLAEWRVRIRMRDVFDVVEQFFAHDPVREACKTVVGRLPRVQREVINRDFFDEESVPDIAESRNASPSTIYNHKAVAQKAMHADDVFFSALHGMSVVRDRARAQRLAETYPDGVMPDGRRIVVIAA